VDKKSKKGFFANLFSTSSTTTVKTEKRKSREDDHTIESTSTSHPEKSEGTKHTHIFDLDGGEKSFD